MDADAVRLTSLRLRPPPLLRPLQLPTLPLQRPLPQLLQRLELRDLLRHQGVLQEQHQDLLRRLRLLHRLRLRLPLRERLLPLLLRRQPLSSKTAENACRWYDFLRSRPRRSA